MKKIFTLFLALVATAALWARPFQVGDLYYKVVRDNGVESMPTVSNPGAGRTTVVLYCVPENTPAGCYAVGTVNGWEVGNTDFMFTPIGGAGTGWVACTFDYAEDMQIKVCAIPSDPDFLGWSYQWGKNIDWENDLEEDNVVILEGTGYLELENQGEPKLVGLADGGVIYIEVKDWANNPYVDSTPCTTAAFRHPWGSGDWTYREATKTAQATFEINAIYGGSGLNVATDVYATHERWYYDQIEFVGDVAQGDSVNFKFISEKQTIGRMIVTLIEKGTGVDNPWYTPSKKSPTVSQKHASTNSPLQVVVTRQPESSDNYAYLSTAYIPETFVYRGKTYEVVGIDEYAFANSPITSITIPNSVTSIGNQAFSECRSLTSITIPNSVTSIGWGAFESCSGLTSPVYNAHSFYYMPRSYIGSYSIPDGIKNICGDAFSSCWSLKSVTIPNSVTSIEGDAFMSCGITSITIPNSVTSIGGYAFNDCEALTSVTIGNGVTSIGYRAFAYCYSLKSITIPNSVTSLGNEAFYGCSSLEYLSIPSSVQYKHYEYDDNGDSYWWYDNYILETIQHCPNLKTLIVPADFFGVGDSYDLGNALDDYQEVIVEILPYQTDQLESLTINSGELPRLAWDFIERNRKTLRTINMSATTNTSIAEEAFKNLYKLENLTLPSQLEYIPYMAVAECVKLQSITIPATVTEIEDRAFENCRTLQSVVFQGANTAKGAAHYAPATGSALKRIGSWAFYNCHQLEHLSIPEGVTEVGDAAFYGCTYLADMTLPSTVQEIGDNGFALCAKLQEIHVKAMTPPSIKPKTFFDVNRRIPVYVPADAVDAYESDPYWSEFDIQAEEAPTSVSDIQSPITNCQKLLRNGQLVIVRDGVEYNAQGQIVKE